MGNLVAKLGAGGFGSPGMVRATPSPIGMAEGPVNPGLISRMVQAPGYGNMLSRAPVQEAAPQESPRQRAARQAAQKAARGNPPPTPAPIGYPPQPLPLEHPRSLPIQKTNPVEVRRGGGMVTNRGF